MRRDPFKRFVSATKLTVFFIFVSTLIYYMIGCGAWPLFDCFYMTIISVTTVGYSEVLNFSGNPLGRVFTIIVVLWGYILLVYFVSIISELLVTGEVKHYFRRKKVRNMVRESKSHYIVCGFGEMGYHVAKEIYASFHPLLIIDMKPNIHELVAEMISPDIPAIEGDASEETVLLEAGLEKAKGVVLALPEDKDKLFTLVTARSINSDVKIASKVVHEHNRIKFLKAGANKVISPSSIGGMRLASELLRPTVTTFLDVMLRDKDKNLRIDEIALDQESDCINKTLQQSNFRSRTNVLIMAVAFENGDFIYNPPADLMLKSGHKLIVLGESRDIAKFKNLI